MPRRHRHNIIPTNTNATAASVKSRKTAGFGVVVSYIHPCIFFFAVLEYFTSYFRRPGFFSTIVRTLFPLTTGGCSNILLEIFTRSIFLAIHFVLAHCFVTRTGKLRTDADTKLIYEMAFFFRVFKYSEIRAKTILRWSITTYQTKKKSIKMCVVCVPLELRSLLNVFQHSRFFVGCSACSWCCIFFLRTYKSYHAILFFWGSLRFYCLHPMHMFCDCLILVVGIFQTYPIYYRRYRANHVYSNNNKWREKRQTCQLCYYYNELILSSPATTTIWEISR